MMWEEKWNKMPTGFFPLGFHHRVTGYWFDKTNTGSEKDNLLPYEWRNTFS